MEENLEKSGQSGIISTGKDELHLQGQLAYVMPNGEKDFIPGKTLIFSRKVIAGAASDNKIRIEQRLVDKYGGKIGEWQKCVGKVESENIFLMYIGTNKMDFIQNEIEKQE